MNLSFEQWMMVGFLALQILLAIGQIVAGRIAWKIQEERINVEKDKTELQKARADFHKEQADDAVRLKQEKKELETTIEVSVKDQKEKDKVIGDLFQKLAFQKEYAKFAEQKLVRMQEDMTRLQAAQFNHPVAVSGTTVSSSALADALSGKKALGTLLSLGRDASGTQEPKL